MVLLVHRVVGNRCDVVAVPDSPFTDLMERHVERGDLHRNGNTTCLVSSEHKHTGIPGPSHIARLIKDTILENRGLKQGESSYRIPHHLISDHILCREFFSDNRPASSESRGIFRITLERIDGRADPLINAMRRYGLENIGPLDTHKIRKEFSALSKYQQMNVWLVRHIHPVLER